ncbi:MAG: PIN domain-containing protein [Deltaproteobacteria bacterium]|nr:PIN domain-containing protein [Deltaproteobacteria bacterium]
MAQADRKYIRWRNAPARTAGQADRRAISVGIKLGRRTAAVFEAAERRAGLVYVPVAVMWECSLLARVGRIELRRSVHAFFDDLFSNPAYQPVDLTPEQLYLADESRSNDDPFDALICAAARHLNVPLLTRDSDIHDFDLVRAVW